LKTQLKTYFVKRFFIILLLSFFLLQTTYSQTINGFIARAKIVGKDTIPILELSQVTIFPPLVFKSKRAARKFGRLVRYVKKVYPYAKIAGIKYNEYNTLLVNVKGDLERKKLMKQAENDLKEEFEGELKKLTFSQGKILIKLIDRETQNTSYKLVKEFRGRVIAGLWQGFARIFSYNLKAKYDPKGKDRDIERIILMIEAGAL